MNTPIKSLRIHDELWEWAARKSAGIGWDSRSRLIRTMICEHARNDLAPEVIERILNDNTDMDRLAEDATNDRQP